MFLYPILPSVVLAIQLLNSIYWRHFQEKNGAHIFFQDLRGYSDFCKLQSQQFGLETCTCCSYSCYCFWSLVSSLSWEVLLEQLGRWLSISGQLDNQVPSGSPDFPSNLPLSITSLITTLGPKLLFTGSFSLPWTIASFSMDFSTSNLPFIPAQMPIFSHNRRSSHYFFD